MILKGKTLSKNVTASLLKKWNGMPDATREHELHVVIGDSDVIEYFSLQDEDDDANLVFVLDEHLEAVLNFIQLLKTNGGTNV